MLISRKTSPKERNELVKNAVFSATRWPSLKGLAVVRPFRLRMTCETFLSSALPKQLSDRAACPLSIISTIDDNLILTNILKVWSTL